MPTVDHQHSQRAKCYKFASQDRQACVTYSSRLGVTLRSLAQFGKYKHQKATYPQLVQFYPDKLSPLTTYKKV